MSVTADDVLPLVPHLRRHAFLLTGSKEVGDDHVRLCLELVMAEPERLEDEHLHIALFRAFHDANRTIEIVDEQLGRLTGGFRERVRSALGLLPPLERRAIVLFVVEGFSLGQTAQILRMDDDKVRQILTEARRHLEALVAKSVLIIEDEPLIALQLNAVTYAMGFTSARLVRRTLDAIRAAEEERPGLVLADLQLDDEGGGIEAAEVIVKQLQVPIVFVTGYPERLATEDSSAPAFVVRKPFRDSHLMAVIGRALAVYASPASAAAHRGELLHKLERLTAA